MLLTLLIFLLILSILVLIHEAGHYFVAKKFGIKVEEFGFGLPPRVLGIKRGETVYSINWLPIGGFVKLYGEDEAGAGRVKTKKQEPITKDLNRAFFARSVGQRAAVVVAGVVMNAILASIIFYLYLVISNFKVELPLLGDHKFFLVNQKNISDVVISNIAKNSPAEKVGIQPFSRIISINGQEIETGKEFVQMVSEYKGKQITIVWEDLKTNKNHTAILVPRVSPPKNEGAVGVSFFPLSTAVLTYETPVQKALSGVSHPLNLMSYNFDIMGRLIAVSFKEKTTGPISQGVSGPVGIYSLVGNIVQIPDLKERILQILNLAGVLSISLAFFNILPIPALDGGRLFFILIEGTFGKKVSPKVEEYAHTIGMAVLLTLILLITFKDITQIFSGKLPFGP